MYEQITILQDNHEYDAFVKKFEHKKTTDDCYTPEPVYNAVKDWVCAKYCVDPACIVRPFWPGGDYEHYNYADDSVVVDNPPFSILTKICTDYVTWGIPFFLFAPALTGLGGRSIFRQINHICANCEITYDNGARVRTGFVTNLGDGSIAAQTAPDLNRMVAKAMDEVLASKRKHLPKYSYPDHVVTAALMGRYSEYGIDMIIHHDECMPISKMDNADGKTIYGGGLLLSTVKAAERAAAERTAAERAAAERFELSPREMEIIAELDDKNR